MTTSLTASRPITLTTEDGITLQAWLHEADGPVHGAVVLVHGFTGRGDAPVIREHADTLVADGYDVVVYDARGHGESAGRCTLGDEERHDVAAAVRFAARRHEHVVVIAESAGAAAALGHAAAVGDLAGLVTLGAPSSWRMKFTLRAVAAAVLTRTGPGVAAARRWLRVEIDPRMTLPGVPTDLAARLQMPLAVIHGLADPFIPPREGEQLHDAAGGPSRLDLVETMGHGFGAGSLDAVRKAVAWVAAAG